MPDMIVADGDRLIQIMYNLIGNAGAYVYVCVGGGGGALGGLSRPPSRAASSLMLLLLVSLTPPR